MPSGIVLGGVPIKLQTFENKCHPIGQENYYSGKLYRYGLQLNLSLFLPLSSIDIDIAQDTLSHQ